MLGGQVKMSSMPGVTTQGDPTSAVVGGSGGGSFGAASAGSGRPTVQMEWVEGVVKRLGELVEGLGMAVRCQTEAAAGGWSGGAA